LFFIKLTILFNWVLDIATTQQPVANARQHVNHTPCASSLKPVCPATVVQVVQCVMAASVTVSQPGAQMQAPVIHLTDPAKPLSPHEVPYSVVRLSGILNTLTKPVKKPPSKAVTQTSKHQLVVNSHSTHKTLSSTHQLVGNSPLSFKTVSSPHQLVNRSALLPQSTDLAMMMQSRHKKRRPMTQNCGDAETPEFHQHNKFQIADEDDEIQSFSDDDL